MKKLITDTCKHKGLRRLRSLSVKTHMNSYSRASGVISVRIRGDLKVSCVYSFSKTLIAIKLKSTN